MGKLTASQLKEISKPGRYGDGAGLYFYVAPTGHRSWVQRVTLPTGRTDKGLGGFPRVTLAQARKVAATNKVQIKAGVNPFESTAIVSAPVVVVGPVDVPTFEYAVQAVYEKNQAKWSDNTGKRWLARMIEHTCHTHDSKCQKAGKCPKKSPLLGKPIDEITRRQLAEILTPLRKEHHETERKVRQGLRVIFRWAVAAEYRNNNPADDALDELIEAVKHTPQHREALHYSEVASALHKVRFGYALRG